MYILKMTKATGQEVPYIGCFGFWLFMTKGEKASWLRT